MPPTKVFDNLYFVGAKWVSAWAITTDGGIILLDSLNNEQEAREDIEGGLKELGLDPASIKKINVTHAHGDHYGGAKYLQEKYHAQVVMSDID
ncbi:MBL fold metallo-hydrolase [Enhydrobacter sp.]|uniref:MBL fold metallo-hydrolase n=1 Tax=Enhydrobacter sp. TaxID=1894999 RepID=UPI002612F5A5|nr:MBL fold metallo-hydrolase [Enhydrobacter sp.]